MSLASWKRRLRPRPIIQQLEIRDLAARALAFQERLRRPKKEVSLARSGLVSLGQLRRPHPPGSACSPAATAFSSL